MIYDYIPSIFLGGSRLLYLFPKNFAAQQGWDRRKFPRMDNQVIYIISWGFSFHIPTELLYLICSCQMGMNESRTSDGYNPGKCEFHFVVHGMLSHWTTNHHSLFGTKQTGSVCEVCDVVECLSILEAPNSQKFSSLLSSTCPASLRRTGFTGTSKEGDSKKADSY